MRAFSSRASLMDKDDSFMQPLNCQKTTPQIEGAISMKVNGWTVRLTATENIVTRMGRLIKALGWLIASMGKGLRPGPTALTTRGPTSQARNTETLEYLSGAQTAHSIKAPSATTTSREWVPTPGPTVAPTKGNGEPT
jgi:hypothetical protein